MKSLNEFCENINEAYSKKDAQDAIKAASKATPAKDVDVKDIPNKKKVVKNKTKEQNDGCYCLEPVTNAKWEEELAEWTMDDIQDDVNALELAERFDDEKDFFCIGDAGWAKTSVITAMAHKFGRDVLTVYLDKATATDLGGIPVPSKTDAGEMYMQYGMPGWALHMVQNPKKKFLLFFDEMNQAQPDVLNALMPIVLKHVVCGVKIDNFIVGAAGNREEENASVSTMNKPLYDRFKPIIEWETHTEGAWASSIKYLHSRYDETLGEDFINKIADMCKYWGSPRDIDRVLLDVAEKNKDRARKHVHPKIVKNRFMSAVWDGVDTNSKSFQRDMDAICDMYIEFVNNGGETKKRSRGRGSNMPAVDKETWQIIKGSLINGFYRNSKTDSNPDGDNKLYLCTLETVVGDDDNPHALFSSTDTNITAEVLEKMVREIESEGKSVMFKTLEEGKKHKSVKSGAWIVA